MPYLLFILGGAGLGGNIFISATFARDMWNVIELGVTQTVNRFNASIYAQILRRALLIAIFSPPFASLMALFVGSTFPGLAELLIFTGFLTSILIVVSIWWIIDVLVAASVYITLLPAFFGRGRESFEKLIFTILMWESHVGVILYLAGPGVSLSAFGLFILALVSYEITGTKYKWPSIILPKVLGGYLILTMVWCVLMFIPSSAWLQITGHDLRPVVRFQNGIDDRVLNASTQDQREMLQAICNRDIADIDRRMESTTDRIKFKSLMAQKARVLYDCAK